ncbi:hypothetical protein C5B42_01615 [Candidatus Cerribacteria bacterium 'Amazon FNV 2010 28 9']|uniref:Uncharacterized protein n=1 Tax=Candidatus Cerribacteria bacterium 'Amazon FNV 2010 28 9' TaxID=2081795 RepID=A0A317JQH8_9BACT|nr:MAG: hypothetical protein C5B42_01615 [Candidatus Cerribacteria bacterium 'Amazon FNV 2010 28 9']
MSSSRRRGSSLCEKGSDQTETNGSIQAFHDPHFHEDDNVVTTPTTDNYSESWWQVFSHVLWESSPGLSMSIDRRYQKSSMDFEKRYGTKIILSIF